MNYLQVLTYAHSQNYTNYLYNTNIYLFVQVILIVEGKQTWIEKIANMHKGTSIYKSVQITDALQINFTMFLFLALHHSNFRIS